MSQADPNNPYSPPPAGPAPGAGGGAAVNPYAAPKSNVAPPVDDAIGGLIENGRRVPVGSAMRWVREGFSIFMMAPGIWILSFIALFFITIFVSFVPLLGGLAVQVLSPVILAGLLIGCHDLDAGEDLRVDHLFEGFKRNTGQLVVVGLLYLLGVVALVVIVVLLMFVFGFSFAMAGSGGRDMMGEGLLAVAIGAIVFLLIIGLSLPLMMAIWFAPALVVFHEQEALSAMKQSFRACLKNFIPFLVYGLILLPLTLVAMLPLFLGILVLWPVIIGGLYRSYQDIFIEPAQE